MDDHQERYERLRRKLITLRSAVRGLSADAADVQAVAGFIDDLLLQEVFAGLVAVGDPRAMKVVEQRRAEQLAEQQSEVH